MEFHEAANIFPLDEESIGDLANDICAYGQKVPIELFDGKILDGRRRWLACERAGVEPKMKDVSPSDPVAYVVSLNLHRRHLTPSQLSMVGAKVREMYDKAAKERKKESGKVHGRGQEKVPVNVPEPIKGDARDIAGKAVGVSGSLIDRATKVIEEGVPELAKAVEDGRMSVSAAAKIAEEPEETQREAAEQAKFSGGRYRKPAIKEEPEEPEKPTMQGVGVIKANEAINSLSRIPKNDALRKRGFQIVTDWIKHNK